MSVVTMIGLVETAAFVLMVRRRELPIVGEKL